jgi:hypothetical protein
VEPALLRAMSEGDPLRTYVGHLILARVCLGQKVLVRVGRCIDFVQGMLQERRFLMEWRLQLVLRHTQSEFQLKEGHRPVAVDIAKGLLDNASLTPERTCLAIGHQLSALTHAHVEELHFVTHRCCQSAQKCSVDSLGAAPRTKC